MLKKVGNFTKNHNAVAKKGALRRLQYFFLQKKQKPLYADFFGSAKKGLSGSKNIRGQAHLGHSESLIAFWSHQT